MGGVIVGLTNYQLEQERVKTARSEHNYACAKLELAQIRCRLAEIECQHEPLESIVPKYLENVERADARIAMVNAAFFVVVGRMPE